MKTYSDFIELSEKKHLDDFYFFTGKFSDHDIRIIEKLVARCDLIDGVASGSIDKSYRSSKIFWIPLSDDSNWLYRKIGSLINHANKKMWDFNIIGIKEPIQYGEYHASENGHYDWHMDIGGKVVDRKISVTIQLSDPDDYQGGDLEFMLSKKINVAPKGIGNVIIFPSYFLHRVTPVTRGIRKSLVIWVAGESFR